MEQTNFTQTKLNTVDDVLRPRFKLSATDRDIYEPIPNKKLWFKPVRAFIIVNTFTNTKIHKTRRMCYMLRGTTKRIIPRL